MTLDLDLRSTADRKDDRRDRIFEALDELESGDDVRITADENVEPTLLRYQIEREVQLARDYADAGPDDWELVVTITATLDEDELPAFDARHLPPQQRHSALTRAFDELAPDEGFVLVNDHDPKPLYHELRSMHGDVLDWEYASDGGDEWRVAIVRTDDSEANADDVVTRFDVREIPKRERHPTIHHRYGMIPDGGTLELIAPHEPKPLQREFRDRYGDAFEWTIVEREPGRCRVQITKQADVNGGQAAVDGKEVSGSEQPSSGDEAGHCCGSDTSDVAADRTADGAADRAAGEQSAQDAHHSTEASDSSETLDVTEELDVRDRPPAQRHQAIFERYADLDRGESFVLVNDHDPKPLYHQFDAEAGPEFRWEYRARDPGEFRVLIGKASTDAAADAADAGSEAPF